MFRWIKDKDKDDKRGKDRKEKKEKKEKKHGKQREKLTYDELKRTNEITKNYLSSYQKSPNSAGGDDENSEKRSTGSEYSLSSSAKSGDSSPMEGHGVGFLSRKSSSPVKHPPPVPKKPLGLHVKSSYSSMQCTSPIKSPSITSNLSSPQGSLANEMMALMDQMGNAKSSKSSVLHLEPTPTVSVEDERRTLFTAPPGEQAGLDVVWKSYDDDLELPSIAPPKPPRARSLTIQRQPAGDFGFSLRRAPVGEHRGLPPTDKKQTIIFAEPSNLERGNETGLLPGDRLLEVNGVVIENKSREDIIELIKTSGDSVTLKVQPVPELSELTVQCGFDGSEVGSPRIRSQTKSAEQLAADRAWLQTNQVWLVHKGGFAGAHLLTAEESPSLPPSEGKLWVRLDAQGSVLEVDQEDVEKANPSHLDRVEDLSELRHLNESSILHTLRQRYASSLIHTYAASTLLVVNPQHPMALYSEKIMKMFRGSKQTDMPPHIYSVGQAAYSALLTSRRDQSVVFLGRSGSGKTTNVRQVLQYLVVTAGCLNNVISVEKLTAISTLLEAFGNCRTVLNSNATRFTQLFSLDFDHSGQIVSASVQAYMVEKARVSRRPEGEPNFNVFYQMLEGIDDALRKELHLENLEEPNIFMSPLQKVEDKHRAGLSWAFLCAALQNLNIQDAEAKAIWSILAAIYHLGAAGVSRALLNKAQFARPQSAQKAASLLGTSVEDLAKIIFSIDFLGSAKNSPRSGNVDVMNDVLESLQALVAGLYSEVFHALLTLINRSLAGSSSRRMASIQVLDSPGFQNPATCNRYSGSQLQDLLYNYCQERLQLLFHKATFQAQEERYTQENISWDSDHYLNLTPEPMVSLIDQIPPQQGPSRSSNINLREEQRGLLWMLDEESMFPNSSEQNFLERIFAHSNRKEKKHLLQKGPHVYLFTLQHLQGTNPVTYNTAGWLRACREHPVVRQASPLLQDSQRDYISQLYVSSRGPSSTMTGTIGSSDSATLRRTSSIRRTQTVATAGMKRRSLPLQVKYTMDALIDILNRSQLHFVQCLLPQHNAGHWNHRSKALKRSSGCEDFLLNVPLLRSQLRGAQIIDSVRVHKQGFPEHLMYGEFRRRVELLVPPEQQPGRLISDEKQAVEQLIEYLDFDKSSYRLGLSQIFLRAGTLARLENQRDEKLHDMIVRFQTHCRGYLARSKLNKYKVQDMAIRCIQRNVRKFLEVKSWPWWRLFIKLTPLLNVHRTEEELRLKTEELETLKAKTLRLEKERNELKQTNEKLEAKLDIPISVFDSMPVTQSLNKLENVVVKRPEKQVNVVKGITKYQNCFMKDRKQVSDTDDKPMLIRIDCSNTEKDCDKSSSVKENNIESGPVSTVSDASNCLNINGEKAASLRFTDMPSQITQSTQECETKKPTSGVGQSKEKRNSVDHKIVNLQKKEIVAVKLSKNETYDDIQAKKKKQVALQVYSGARRKSAGQKGGIRTIDLRELKRQFRKVEESPSKSGKQNDTKQPSKETVITSSIYGQKGMRESSSVSQQLPNSYYTANPSKVATSNTSSCYSTVSLLDTSRTFLQPRKTSGLQPFWSSYIGSQHWSPKPIELGRWRLSGSLDFLPNSSNCSRFSQVSELWADLNEEHSAATHASEMLETETSERMKLEKEIQDMQTRCSAVQQRNDRMEMEMMETRMYRSTELNGDLSDEDEAGGSIYKQKYEHMKRELELTKRRLQQQHEEELETHMLGKKAADKKLAEALEEAEEERRVANQWKRKAQKLGQEMQDLRLLMEDHMNRNADLEKKQRKYVDYFQLMQLKRTKQEMERKVKDQEEELEDLAGQVQLLEQGKLRLEMAMEKLRQETRKELSAKEEEVEEIRMSATKKVKNLEAQLENEQEDRHQLMKQKHELERKIIDMSERPPEKDPELERRLRRDLRRTKALLRDAQDMMEHAQDGQGNKLIIRQLKNQLEDAEFAKTAAIKARQGIELELQNVQNQLEEITKTKNEAEGRCLQLSREKSALQTQLEEIEEEQGEVLKKYKSAVQQMTNDQKLLSDQTFQITDLEEERQMLKEQIGELTSRLEHISNKSEDPIAVKRVEAKMRELESRLDFEQINRSRLEKQLERLKEQCDRLREENETLKTKDHHAQEGEKRLQRQIRELREDYTNLQQKECEAHQKCRELELSLENTEADLQSTKNDLRLACQRIQDLQCALEEDLDTSTDVPDDSGSDSENSSDIEPSHHQFSSGRQYSMGENPSFSLTHLRPLPSSRDDDETDLSPVQPVGADCSDTGMRESMA
ncbi:unconventional myosin-XVIIIa-like [Limulus polyphemus]|uniref:Unconventional myosin-XVIIIa-like n=1 Tax=Limulus polyphemus TaxID=6850 RepID=A0ABM1SZH5_LIMPO|nr:unconventional myosin-XVIIIa-like [Limulus polyphemus]